jgi:very-short-patch-repair endonuclease
MQTLNDVAPTSTAWELERFIAEAHGRKLLDASQASTRVRAAIDGGVHITRSKAEQLLLKLVRRAGLPEPETNAELGPWTIDALWRPQRVAVEIDSWAWHGTRRSFERDRRKDRALRAAGLTPVRITARQLQDEEIAVAADLGATLARAA